MDIARISPWRWTWEWAFVFALPFAILWHQIARLEIGEIDIAAVERAGRTTAAEVLRIDGGPGRAKPDRPGRLEAMSRRFEFFVVDLAWTDSDGSKRQTANVRINADLGQALHLDAPEAERPRHLTVRYLPRPPGIETPSWLQSREALLALPFCEPYADCNLFVVVPDGRPSFDPTSRFWHVWGGTIVVGCLAGLIAVLGLRLAGRIGRRGAGTPPPSISSP
jgi:hypothetical protein